MEAANKHSAIAIWISLLSNIALTLLKLTIGLLFNSQVLIADGVHNAGDVFATATALISMNISKRPPDEDHPYGHGKAEVVGAGIVAMTLLIAGLFMGYHSITSLFANPNPTSVIVLGAALISLIWKQILYMYTMKIGRRSSSSGLIATAYDHLADVYASLAASIGILLALAGHYWGIKWLQYGDPAAGIVVAYFVVKLAIHMGQSSVDVLMEKNIDGEQLSFITTLVASVPQVKRIDRIRAREHGHYIIVDVRVGLDGHLTIQEGHDISRHIKQKIQQQVERADEVLIHINPWYPDGQ